MKHFSIIATLLLLSGFSWTFAQPPVINSFTPTSGAINTIVTINGTGFNSIPDSNVVYFGSIHATVKSASSTMISATVPAGATRGSLTVINKGTRLLAKSTSAFDITFLGSELAFNPVVRLNPKSPAMNVKLADMDGDGKADILATAPHYNTLMVFRNKSQKEKIDTTSFTEPLTYPTGPQAGFVAVEDLDGDGKLDIVLLNVGFTKTDLSNNSLSFYRNVGKPGNINLMPVAVSDTVPGKPDYNFILKPGDKDAIIGDIDGDGKPDLVVLNKNGFITIFRNTYTPAKPTEFFFGAGITIQVGISLGIIKLGDMDNDGKTDIVITNDNDHSIITLRNNCTVGRILQSSFVQTEFPLNFRPTAINLKDMDGDGKLDTVLDKPENNSVSIIQNTSIPGDLTGNLINITELKISPDFYNDLMTQDINGDGKLDFVSLSATQDSIYFYPNKSEPLQQISSAYFKDRIDIPIVTIPDCVADLDGDGIPDMIVGSAFGIDIYHHKINDVPTSIPREEEVSSLSMTIYPNPASTITNIKYNLLQKSQVSITVYDNVGRVLLSADERSKTPGDHIKTIDTSGLKDGIYVLKLTTDSSYKTGKLLIIR
ncbi:FG-GAP-like repeat-containing protein [Pedobacter arcticus]|uniref:FG-GAP-like repeat-containing protein n=1 Tax=Pedobacter arcticus TaxID=752140 RepID=UPI00036C0614|nr:FG-GAP-like repeat-containing protein [Pedobacter arcticus]